MKFISGIIKYKISDNKMTVLIPDYHRAATGLLSEATVYLYPRITAPNNEVTKEIILSPFSPIDWTNIWKLELKAKDRPSLTKRITDILSENDINIFIQESLITNYDQEFTVFLIADFRQYFRKLEIDSAPKLDAGEREALRSDIEKLFNLDPEFNYQVQRFEPIEFLIKNSQEVIFNNNHYNKIARRKLIDYYKARSPAVQINEKKIVIESKVLSDVELISANETGEKIVEGTMFSDTEEKFIIIRFFEPGQKGQKVIHLEIVHEDRVGAINLFTKKIHEFGKGEYNIISCYNRVEDYNKTARWHVLIEVSHEINSVPDLILDIRKEIDIVRKVYIKGITSNFPPNISAQLELSEERRPVKHKKILELEQSLIAKENKINLLQNNIDKLGKSLIAARKEKGELSSSLEETGIKNEEKYLAEVEKGLELKKRILSSFIDKQVRENAQYRNQFLAIVLVLSIPGCVLIVLYWSVMEAVMTVLPWLIAIVLLIFPLSAISIGRRFFRTDEDYRNELCKSLDCEEEKIQSQEKNITDRKRILGEKKQLNDQIGGS